MDLMAFASTTNASDEYAVKILDATEQLLLAHGLRRTSMADIVQASGVSKATLFRRFPTRADLMNTLLLREVQKHHVATLAYLEQFPEPTDRFVAIATHFIESMVSHPLLKRLLETDSETILPLLTTQAEPVMSFGRVFLMTELTRLTDAGFKLNSEPAICAELLIRAAHSLLLTPSTVLPLDNKKALTNIVRATLLPMVLKA